MEGLVPALLALAHPLGLLLTALFHIALGTVAFDFSSTKFASLALWAPGTLVSALGEMTVSFFPGRLLSLLFILLALATVNTGELPTMKLAGGFQGTVIGYPFYVP